MAQNRRNEGERPFRDTDARPDQPRGQEGRGPKHQPQLSIPASPADVVLGRPTATSIVLNAMRDSDGKVLVAYGIGLGNFSARTAAVSLKQGQPTEILLEGLKPDSRYFYQLRDAATGRALVEGNFHTRRTPGSGFSFTVTADSHLDQNTDLALYQRTLANALADGPDFHIDLGDTFMTSKHENRDSAARQYAAQRYYFSRIGQSVPLFLVLGNHDGEQSKLLRGGPENLAVWSNALRKRYFSNPAPNGFYTGNVTRHVQAGQLHDYYAWPWGNVLFVALNPYWHSSDRRSDDNWGISLGEEQYRWLKKTLETSRARFKFIFVHQLVGGFGRQGRGGAEAASFGEWGGKNTDGSDGFAAHRPGWEMPIHQLLARHRVSIVFHGHDHLFAKQDLDGIVYQEVPQPGHPATGMPRFAAEYGYREGVILGGSGYLRIGVSSHRVRIDFVRVSAPGQERCEGEVAFSYEMADSGKMHRESPDPMRVRQSGNGRRADN